MADQSGYNVGSTRSITILRPPGELYDAWRKPGVLVNFLPGAESVNVFDEHHSRWLADIPGKGPLSWESEITGEQEDSLISWRTVNHSGFDHAGSVRFIPAPGGLGTEVELTIRARRPVGRLTQTIAWVLGRSLEDYVSRMLHSFKQFMETGEVATNKGPSGRDISPDASSCRGGAS